MSAILQAGAMSGLSVVLLLALARDVRAAEPTWDVFGGGDLDARIERQLNALAARHQTPIHFYKTAVARTEETPSRGVLTIEFHRENSTDGFLDSLKREVGAAETAPAAELAGEGSITELHYASAAAPNRLRITAVTWRGFHNALLRVPDLLALAPSQLSARLVPHPQAVHIGGNGRSAVIADFPNFPERGVVEGFYGTPWTHQDRINMLGFEGAHGMNVYYYAPKDDPYHRKLWRDPYPPEAQQRLRELVQAANQNFVDFCFAISPALTMTYSSPQDYQALIGKLDSVSKLGVSCFALFLDDVPPELRDARDREQFKSVAQAHVDLTNKVYKHLKEQSPANRLTLTPTTYTNEWGNRDYVQELGAGVEPGVSIAWTGPKVFSPAITAQQAREWGAFIHRQPLVWDNYPVNDGTPWCRYLGPLVGRDPRLARAAHGFISNPMIEPTASLIPLQTVAEYLWNSAAYDAAESVNHAVVSQYGQDAPQQLTPFLKIYGTYYWDDGNFMALFKERRRPIDVARMRSQLAEMNAALERLRGQQRLQPLLREISPAIKRTSGRLAEVNADPAFRHLPDGKLQWDENFDALSAGRIIPAPNLDGDFSKWESGTIYHLDERNQLAKGDNLWRGPQAFSARVALAWDSSHLYAGVDVVDPDLYQPYSARGIQNGDNFAIALETGFSRNFFAIEPTGQEYLLYFSPGNFAGVAPSIFSDEDYLPTRPESRDYMKEIQTAWKKTAKGYSGDIAIPVTYFDGGQFKDGYELGFGFSVAKVFRPTRLVDSDDLKRIVLQSRKDHLFRISTSNPSSFPRLLLTERKP